MQNKKSFKKFTGAIKLFIGMYGMYLCILYEYTVEPQFYKPRFHKLFYCLYENGTKILRFNEFIIPI